MRISPSHECGTRLKGFLNFGNKSIQILIEGTSIRRQITTICIVKANLILNKIRRFTKQRQPIQVLPHLIQLGNDCLYLRVADNCKRLLESVISNVQSSWRFDSNKTKFPSSLHSVVDGWEKLSESEINTTRQFSFSPESLQ